MTPTVPLSSSTKPRPGDSGVAAPPRDESEHLPADPHGSRPTSQVDSRHAAPFSSLPGASRCNEKGCVFPAAGPGNSKCLTHSREESEPKHFGSSQPTVLLLDRAKFGLPDPETEPDDSRARDRRRELVEREAFFEDAS